MRIFNKAALGLLWLYRKIISPYLGSNCRYLPTCSSYAVQAFQAYPFHKAVWLTLKRLGKCHPWTQKKGFIHDPLPCERDKNHGN